MLTIGVGGHHPDAIRMVHQDMVDAMACLSAAPLPRLTAFVRTTVSDIRDARPKEFAEGRSTSVVDDHETRDESIFRSSSSNSQNSTVG